MLIGTFLLSIILISLLVVKSTKPKPVKRKLKYSVSSLKRSVTDSFDDEEEI